jgi:hypothetical protein
VVARRGFEIHATHEESLVVYSLGKLLFMHLPGRHDVYGFTNVLFDAYVESLLC